MRNETNPRSALSPLRLILFGVWRNADEKENFSPWLSRVQPRLPAVKVRSSYIFSLLDGDEWTSSTSTALWIRPGFGAGVPIPCATIAGHSGEDWWTCLPERVWGSSSWTHPGLCWFLPLTGWFSAALLIEQWRLTGNTHTHMQLSVTTMFHIIVPSCCFGHFAKRSNVSDDKTFYFNLQQNEKCIIQGRHQFCSEAGGEKGVPLKCFHFHYHASEQQQTIYIQGSVIAPRVICDFQGFVEWFQAV